LIFVLLSFPLGLVDLLFAILFLEKLNSFITLSQTANP
jgi:hypothetical protein